MLEVIASGLVFPCFFLTALECTGKTWFSKQTIMASGASAYLFGGFRLEPAQRRLLHEGSPVDLPPKAFDALVLLVENAGGLVGKEAFHAALWPRAVVSDVNLNKAIWQIRRALGD